MNDLDFSFLYEKKKLEKEYEYLYEEIELINSQIIEKTEETDSIIIIELL